MYSLVFYSHSEYSDAWGPMFGQTDKYFDDSYKKYLFVNKGEYDIPSGWTAIEYDDELPYQQRVVSCLEKLDNKEIVVFHHEDMFLFDSPDFDKMVEIEQTIDSEKAHFIKLCKATYRPEEFYSQIYDEIYLSPIDIVFAIQPTMCKVKNLLKIYGQTPGLNIWEFEENSNFTCIENNMICCFVNQRGEEMVGSFHWESFTYPYISTAIVKGKWNTEEYASELATVFEEYSIDPSIRGINT